MKTFEERLRELEKLNERIKSSETSLQEAVSLFEQAAAAAKSLEKELRDAERRVEILLQDEEGNDMLKPFDEEEQRSL